jgi:uncharacterized Zn-finger protein
MAGPRVSGAANTETASSTVTVGAGDLSGPGVVFCPNPKMPLWSTHPRVFIDVASTGEGRCPYCGTLYRLADGVAQGRSGH